MGVMDRTKNLKLREAGERARGRIAGDRRGPGWLGAAIVGVLGGITGAVIAFLTDPARGKARRARMLDQGAATVRQAGREAGRAVRAATSMAEGKMEALTNAGSRVAATDDVTLRSRAETELFRDPKVPKGTINISAERGILVLRGEVPDVAMRKRLVRKAEAIEGVWSVHDLLHLPGEPAPDELTAAVSS